MIQIRPSRDEDVEAITAIYAHHVLHGTGTFETEPPDAADMAGRRADVLSKNLPYLVAERDGELLGIGSLFVREAAGPGRALPGNMFVPVELLRPVLAEMQSTEIGRASCRERV